MLKYKLFVLIFTVIDKKEEKGRTGLLPKVDPLIKVCIKLCYI